jgi:hypothetical protein
MSAHKAGDAPLVHVQGTRALNAPLHHSLHRIERQAVRRSLASQASLSRVLKATVRSSGNGSHARLSFGLKGTMN